MTDFNDWFERVYLHEDPSENGFLDEMRKAYEAGAASQAGTLRDEFAMAVDGLDAKVNDQYADRFNADKKPPEDDLHAWVKWFAKADANLRYIRADAMLEARKTTGEGEA